jgi:hypothetical protein
MAARPLDAAARAPDTDRRSTPQPSSASLGKPLNGTGTYHVYSFTPPLPAEPTDALPGSEAKVAVMEERWRRRRHIHHPEDLQAEERHDFRAEVVVGGRREGPARTFVYRRLCGRRYVWDVDIPARDGRLRSGPFATPEKAIAARDAILAERGLTVDGAPAAPEDRSPSHLPEPGPAMQQHSQECPYRLGDAAGEFVRKEFPPLDSPVVVHVYLTASREPISVSVEPLADADVVAPAARSRKRRRPEFDPPP